MKWIKSVVYFSELPDSMRLSPYRRDKRGSWIFALGLVAYEKFFMRLPFACVQFFGYALRVFQLQCPKLLRSQQPNPS